ncbi:head decoration protein [Brenneria populi subsp. brevivirga]|uniref:head decoration protein n=1 Tax=Brenneria populi TaxID=1505588 RepID=UPI002E17CC60|nr:head decoration protein [Brenneria populi subsp. brevivirga]
MVTLNEYGQNAWGPLYRQDTFIPDQLIAGPLQLVTDNVTIAIGATATYKRGTVLGKITASGKYTLSLSTATDGSEDPVAILVDDADATAADVTAGVYLMGEFNALRVTHDASWTLADLKAALRPHSIFLKDVVEAPVTVATE